MADVSPMKIEYTFLYMCGKCNNNNKKEYTLLSLEIKGQGRRHMFDVRCKNLIKEKGLTFSGLITPFSSCKLLKT